MIISIAGQRNAQTQQIIDGIIALRAGYDDIVIDITGRTADVYRPALISAQLAIVLLHVEEARLDKKYGLIAQLNAARMFNPELQVLFAVIAGDADPTPAEIAAVRSYCGEVLSARLCGILIEPGPNLATGLDALCRKVFDQHPVQSGSAFH